MKKTIFILLIPVILWILIFSLYKIFTYLKEGKSGTIIDIPRIEESTENNDIKIKKNPINFNQYENKDVVGYIIIENLGISYPILQGQDNSYYLSHNYEKQYSSHGSIFFDYQADLENLDKLQNIFIYGHSMLDKTMFGKLLSYTDSKVFNGNKNIYLYLKRINAKLTLEVFSVYSDYGNEMYEKVFADYDGRQDYISKALSKGEITQKTESKKNTIITLYTCSHNNSRCYVHSMIKEIEYYE